MNELTVGNKRKFTFTGDKEFMLREILEKPEISMYWTWTSGICPHCKEKIERIVKHDFYRIEILSDVSKKDEELTIEDFVLMGDTLDNRRMIISQDLYNQVFEKSENFKKFIKRGD